MPDVTSLESPTPTPTPAPAPAPAPEPDLEGTVEVAGKGKMAPVAALQAERTARQRAEAELQELRPLADNWRTVEPYVPLLATHPKVTGKNAPAPAPAPAQDPKLLEVADAFGFYDAEGNPDLKRAERAQRYMDTNSRTVAGEVVGPVSNLTATTAAAALRQQAYATTDKQGRPMADRKNIDAVLDSIAAERPDLAADPRVVNMAVLIARGMSEPAAGEPLHTEGGGGGRGGSPNLSKLEEQAARVRGITPEQWIKQRDLDSNVLE